MLPLAYNLELSVVADLAIAVLLGIGFGYCLERAGFGSARKLTAVFYLHDKSVVKVMFTAIVTTMAGLFLLSSAGLIALTDLYIEPTSYPAQLLGGLVFGAGFVIGGYCPGTSVAGIATGKKDAMLFALGMLAGVMAYAEFTPGIEAWIKSTSQGELTLPALTGIGMGWWTLVFAVILFAAAHGMKWLERRFAHLRPPHHPH
jgi:hypothetical protein